MRRITLLLSVLAVMRLALNPALAADRELTDVTSIGNFLNDTRTHIFPGNGLQWRTQRSYLDIGTKSGKDTCSYEFHGSTSNAGPGDNIVTVQSAVNSETCEALVSAGTLTTESWGLLQKVLATGALGARQPTIVPYKSTVAPATKSQAVVPNTGYSANTQNNYNYTVQYTDGNNLLQKLLLDIFAFNVAEISVNLAYEYDSTTPPPIASPTCSINAKQEALYGNAPIPGQAIAGWKLLSGGSCEALIQYAGEPIRTYIGFDAQGNLLKSANVDLCNLPLNKALMQKHEVVFQLLGRAGGVVLRRQSVGFSA